MGAKVRFVSRVVLVVSLFFLSSPAGAAIPDVLKRAALWFDASDAATVVRDDGGRVREWRSKGLRQLTAKWSGAQPVYDATAWGVPTVDFGEIGSGRDLRYPR